MSPAQLFLVMSLALASFASGCGVTVYQPMRGLARPVVLEHRENNFADKRLLIRCLTHETFERAAASTLCQKLSNAFSQQGALVETQVPFGVQDVPDLVDEEPADLVLEIESKREHKDEHPFTAVISVFTLTLVPAVEEESYVQRAVVYGPGREVLASDVYRERFIEYFGGGVWSINWLLDTFFRDDKEKLGDDAAKKNFSRDFYAQTRQLVFNADVRANVLGLARERPKETPVDEELDEIIEEKVEETPDAPPEQAPPEPAAPQDPVDPAGGA